MSILAGIRVIDCGTYIAGPAAATVMSDFGADVIKIERPPHGDPYRYLPLVPGMPAGNTDYWARSGLMATMRYAGADPVQSPAGFGDHPTSMALFGAIMLALYERQRTGRGMKVSTSLMANGAWSNACQIQAAFCGATFMPRWTRATAINPLVNHYVARDGVRFFFALLEPKKDWTNICRALERTDLLDDPRF